MASVKNVKRTASGRVQYRGETFAGFNKPKRTPNAKKKSAVLAKKGDQIKLVRFGDQNKSKSTISPENYKNMQEGFPDKMRYGGEVKKMRYGGEAKKMRYGGEVKNDKSVRGPCS